MKQFAAGTGSNGGCFIAKTWIQLESGLSCNLIRYFNDIALFKLYVHTISMQTGDHSTVTQLGDINTATCIYDELGNGNLANEF